ncbi:hypothetical protein [Bifidobacterium choloepi]|uniref:CTP synthase n=1 Tax=Bifidobacterium choloepi TaxID=2614131 RepID=A0A6I5MZF9_9BIFI|nr:hypothetical protein [Bifidobacterium choloepi]NEG69687.1 hypothetical protein [Bifidobacterium choloepi]
MRNNSNVDMALAIARAEQRCAFATDRKTQAAAYRRIKSGELGRPLPGLFMIRTEWEAMSAHDQVLHAARALHARSGGQYIFAGPTAAVLMGLELNYSAHEHGIYVICGHADSNHPVHQREALDKMRPGPLERWNGIVDMQINRLPRRSFPDGAGQLPDVVRLRNSGIPVTSPARTLTDIAMLLDFPRALAAFDSAARRGMIDPGAIHEYARHVRGATVRVERLLTYANAAAANGGESLMRGILLGEGFPVPWLQEPFPSADRPQYYTDFSWHLPGGVILVAEYDGSAKYSDPSMTNGQNARTIGHRQADREIKLREWGVRDVARVFYADLVQPIRLVNKLQRLGVPRNTQPYGGFLDNTFELHADNA